MARRQVQPTRNGHVRRPQFYGGPDPITLHKMESILNQARNLRNESQLKNNSSWPVSGSPTSMQRGAYERGELDPRRNYAFDCGWPLTIDSWQCKELIDREPMAGLVNEIYPLESWQVEPLITDDADHKVNTGFKESFSNLHRGLRREPSYHEENAGSVITQILLNLDQLAGYGRYGALLVGLNDGRDLSEPVQPRKGMQCTFLRPFPEHMARVTLFDMDWNSPRYGLPVQYLVTFADPTDMSVTGVNENFMARQVHWSRIVHVTDKWHHPTSSPIFAIERLRPVLNAILDYRKVRGPSAEAFYQACMNALHFGTHPQLGPDVEMDRDSILDMYEQFINGMQRILVTSGGTVDPIAPTVTDPASAALIQIQAICMKMRIPFRILMGSEIGQLASGDDKVKWIKRLMARETYHNTPSIIVPVVDRLINVGVLEKPKGPYKVKWPKIDIQTAAERMDSLFKRTQAYGFYVTQNVEAVVPPLEYMTKFDSLTVEEATEILESASSHLDEIQGGGTDLLSGIAGVDDLINPPEGPVGSPGEYETGTPNQLDSESGTKLTKESPPVPLKNSLSAEEMEEVSRIFNFKSQQEVKATLTDPRRNDERPQT